MAQQARKVVEYIRNRLAELKSNTGSRPALSSADEILKFKSLLDAGIITQEEFESKKKELLGL